MAIGKYPRYNGGSKLGEILKDKDVLREIPEFTKAAESIAGYPVLKGLSIAEALNNPITAGKVLGVDVLGMCNIRAKFWELFDMNDAINPTQPVSYEEGQLLKWFAWYDSQISQAERAQRQGKTWSATYDGKTYASVAQLDYEADVNALKLKNLRTAE